MLLVDMREAVGRGLTIRPIRTMMNHATTELFFDGLKVSVENLIGEEGKGFRYLLDGLAPPNAFTGVAERFDQSAEPFALLHAGA